MRDNDLLRVLIPIINASLSDSGLDIVTRQSYQPTQQGVPPTSGVFIHKIADKRYGYPKSVSKWDNDLGTMVHTMTEIMESTYQVDALSIQDPTTPDAYTASDILNVVAQALQSDATIQTLKASGVQILRIVDIRQTYFVDDKARHEAMPSFDFVISHKNDTITVDPIISQFQVGIRRV